MKEKKAFLPVLLLLCAILLAGCGRSGSRDSFQTVSDLNRPDVTIGGQTGSAHEPLIAEVFPLAKEKQFAGINEMLIALDHGQIDAFVHAQESLTAALEEKPDQYRMLEEPIGETECGMAVSPKTRYPQLVGQLNTFLADLKASGELDELYQRWMVDSDLKMPEIPLVEDADADLLVVGTSGELVPNSFYESDRLVGYDIELTLRFAYAYHYRVEFRAESITARLNDAEFGKVDLLSGGILKTPERAERVIFPDTPVYTAPVAVMARGGGRVTDEGFWKGLVSSVEKTLIREDRWRMILCGLSVTLLLSLGTLLLGSLTGFALCMGRRSRLRVLSVIVNGFIGLIDGIPIVLVLMICFYVVFSGLGLKEIPVAIIAFSISFGCRVAVILDTGMNGVAPGEVEAAEAMGMTAWQVFRKVQFPQAVGLAFDMYKGQVVTMIKNTSIVGYIAVQDLTKVSDIIRARTYESFFSLVFTALIYFLIARMGLVLLTLLGKMIDPRSRSRRRSLSV